VRLSQFCFAGAIAAGLASCFFDTDIPLENAVPALASTPCFSDTDTLRLNYPDSVVCTLSVEDRSDSILWVDPSSWQGSSLLIRQTLDTKEIALFLGTNHLGEVFSGLLTIRDAQDSACRVPYAIEKIFIDSFLQPLPDARFWNVYDAPGDSFVVHQQQRRLGLEFLFKKDTVREPATLSLVSTFSLKGDFSWSIDYWLYWLQFYNSIGFELEFSSSTSFDTGQFSGDKAKMLLSIQDGLKLQCSDPSGKSFSRGANDFNYYDGMFKFVRAGSEYFIYFKPQGGAFHLINEGFSLRYDQSDSAYIHIRMTIADHTTEQSCIFPDFIIQQGVINF